MTILLCTLGTSWAVIPETYALLMPERCPLYLHHPGSASALRAELGDPVIHELWVVTTSGTKDQDRIPEWWRAIGTPGSLRIWRTPNHDGAAQTEVELIRELILRAALLAGPSAILSLSGGRKTMSADLQRAGMTFGCAAMLHVLPPEPLPALLKSVTLEDLTKPLPVDIANGIQPVLVGSGRPGDLLTIDPAITAERFPLPDAGDWSGPGPEGWLWKALEEREREGGRLLANFHATIAQSDPHETWRSLSRLPPAVIQRLRSERLGPQHRDWLIALPKAELHCHLGGILDLVEQREVGQAVWQTIDPPRRAAAAADAQSWLRAWIWPADPARRQAAAGWLLAHEPPDRLRDLLFPPNPPRVDLVHRHPRGFAAFEHPGALVGSTILHDASALLSYARSIRARCRRDGLAYLELRGSPQKYYGGQGLEFLRNFQAALTQERQAGDAEIRMVIIADRRQGDRIKDVVDLALTARERLDGFVVGIDLAGDENEGDLAALAPAFARAFAECLPITIHAGEGQPAANIWAGAYHLHADRIGHGLTLADRPELANRFRERRICLELCPTSNVEVVGYRDPENPHTADCPPYPWAKLWRELHLPLTLCTDNPGISRTTLADEYLALARMTPGGISPWEVLSMIRQGFLHAFLPSSERGRLMKAIDGQIGEMAMTPLQIVPPISAR